MKRLFAVVAVVAVLATMFPAAVSAGPVLKFEEHQAIAGCNQQVDGGFVSMSLGAGVALGGDAFADIWLDPALPFEDPPSLTGTTDAVDLVEGAEIVLSATLAMFGPDGTEQGEGTIVATLTRVGDTVILPSEAFGNRTSHTELVSQDLEGSGIVTLPDGTEFEVPCLGGAVDGQVFETGPTAFTNRIETVTFQCVWDSSDTLVAIFGEKSGDQSLVGAVIISPTVDASTIGQPTGTFDARGVSLALELEDGNSGDVFSATADAVFTPVGDPVKSIFLSANRRATQIRQDLSVDGTYEVTPGESYPMDDTHCFAVTDDFKVISTIAAGPASGKPPANDTPEGAIALEVGSRLNLQTVGAAVDAEVPNETCPSGPFDLMSHTVWFTIEGNGDPITIATDGSDFDTVVAAFTRDGDTFVEIACNNDIIDDVAVDLQGSMTFDTEDGVTYWIEAGGTSGEIGRLRLEVS